MIKYEGIRIFAPTETTKFRMAEQEFDTKEEAQAYVEADQDELGWCGGKVITWHVGPNLPGCTPELKYSSCGLELFDADKMAWRGVDIF